MEAKLERHEVKYSFRNYILLEVSKNCSSLNKIKEVHKNVRSSRGVVCGYRFEGDILCSYTWGNLCDQFCVRQDRYESNRKEEQKFCLRNQQNRRHSDLDCWYIVSPSNTWCFRYRRGDCSLVDWSVPHNSN